MDYFKKYIRVLVFASISIGLFGLHDLSAMEKKSEKTEKSQGGELESIEVFGTKTDEKFLLIFNQVEFFKKKIWEPYNILFKGDFSEAGWSLWHKDIIISLENCDFKKFFHVIMDFEKNDVASFVYGFFYDENKGKKSVFISCIGTVPKFEKNGLAWRLIVSIFDEYLDVSKITLNARSGAVSFYKRYQFSQVGEIDEPDSVKFEITREKVAEMRGEFEGKRKKKS